MQHYSKYRGRKKFLSDINVTPFVDVMLVLLIVFMVTAPLLQTGVEIELPEVDTPNIPDNKDPIIITINKNNETFISKKRITANMLNKKLKEIIEKSNPYAIINCIGMTDVDECERNKENAFFVNSIFSILAFSGFALTQPNLCAID